jgi:hypothetical protein
MATLSMVSMSSVCEAQTDDRSIKTIALFSCIGLVASFCLVTLGLDLSASWL